VVGGAVVPTACMHPVANCSLLTAMEPSGSRNRRERCWMADSAINALAALQIVERLHLKHKQLGLHRGNCECVHTYAALSDMRC